MFRSWLGLVLSLVGHSLLFAVVSMIVVRPKTETVMQRVVIREIPKPPAVTPIVEAPKNEPPPPPPKTRKPRVREDKRVEPAAASQPVPEVRAGLSDSLAPDGKSSGPSIAQGNSAEMGVDPKDANKSPPPAVAVNNDPVDPNASPVSEASADTPAKCKTLGEIQITDDAVNAGVTSGKVVIEAVIGFDGKVVKAVVKKGTGYDVDKVVLARVLKMNCAPAKQAGKDVAQRWRIEIPISL